MKKASRVVYLELATEVDTPLCSFCKFCEEGYRCGENECQHPLWRVSECQSDIGPYDDCWGFRPDLPISDIADIVGIIIANQWEQWSYVTNNGITVSGRKL